MALLRRPNNNLYSARPVASELEFGVIRRGAARQGSERRHRGGRRLFRGRLQGTHARLTLRTPSHRRDRPKSPPPTNRLTMSGLEVFLDQFGQLPECFVNNALESSLLRLPPMPVVSARPLRLAVVPPNGKSETL
jgi:hypothetical protein